MSTPLRADRSASNSCPVLAGDTLRLDPLLPGGGGESSGGPFVLTASIGQVDAQDAGSAQVLMRGGFWTPADAAGVDSVFRSGVE